MSVVEILPSECWENVCELSDLVPNSGVCALVQGQQIAIFYLPEESPSLYALGNWDPIGKANIICRGIVGSINGELCVASPLYKQHFSLATGACLEEDEFSLQSYAIRIMENTVQLAVDPG